MKENIIQKKSYAFALRIVQLYQYLVHTKKEFVLSKQILRSGTSIWANIEEAIWWQSKKDFISKMSVVYKEARETRFRLNLLYDGKILDQKLYSSLLCDVEEILKIVTAIQKTAKKKTHEEN